MSELIACRGLSGSGKSRWAREEVAKDFRTIRVNRDDIRIEIHGNLKWTPEREKKTVKLRNLRIRNGLEKGLRVISDDTNLSPKVMRELEGIARSCNATFSVKDFTDVSPWDCVKNDTGPHRTSVGAEVIWKQYRQYLAEPVIQRKNLHPAIIVDMDGTLAKLNGQRSPYDDANAHLDDPNEFVVDMVDSYLAANPDVELIIISGRDEGRSRDVTLAWIDKYLKYGLPDRILMRKAGDVRSDHIVKRELFDEYVRNRFYIRFVVDDRLSVAHLWRDVLGLPLFHCEWGFF